MGEKNETEFYFRLDDGEKVKIEPLPEITETGPARAEETDFRLTGDMETEIPLKIPKNYRCGSRKRFIKLLMSIGVERNQAADIADGAKIMGATYGGLWHNLFFWGAEKRGRHEPV